MRPAAPRLLTVNEAAARYRITRQTLYLWIKKGVVPTVRVGPARRLRVPLPAADRALLHRPDPA